MQRSQLKSLISSDDDDDDYELPSLAERVKVAVALRSSQVVEKISSESDSDEDGFQKFSERIRSTPFSQTKCQSIMTLENTTEKSNIEDPDPEENHAPPVRMNVEKISSESDSDEDGFQKFSERIRSTPFSQTKCQSIMTLENTTEKSNMKDPDPEENHAPPVRMKLDFSVSSESEEELSTLNTEKKQTETDIQKLQFRGCFLETSESDSDEVFSNLSERLSRMNTPSKANKENCNPAKLSNTGETFLIPKKLSTYSTPLPQNRKKYSKSNNSESDESFSSFVEKLKTPLPVIRKNYSKSNNSESDESFSNFVEKLQTPLPLVRKNYSQSKNSESDGSFSSFAEKLHTPFSVKKKNMLQKYTESDSDDSFLSSVSRCNSYHTPMSQSRNNRIGSPLTKNLENKLSVDKSQNKGALKSISQCQNDNEKEFQTLFPLDVANSSFLRDRATCTRKLFNFLNKKIFDSKLPEDMPIVWVASLTSTAGLTCCLCKNNVYTCTIKLSLKLLSSFDRLQNTLLHEMCHAAVWIINKQHRVRHGPLWQIWASRCKMILPFIECPERCHNYEIQYSVWYRCTTCDWKKGRCKRVRKYEGAVCKRCKNPIIMTCV